MHVRIASPPLMYPCYMGINIPTREELIANQLDNVKLAYHTGTILIWIDKIAVYLIRFMALSTYPRP